MVVSFHADEITSIGSTINVMSFNDTLGDAAAHLSANDNILQPVIASAGIATIRPHKNYYWSLVSSIISQQLSVKAAHSIEQRFLSLFDDPVPPPQAILEKSVEELRSAGLSNAKANYIRDLAQHVIDGRLKFDALDAQTNDTITAELMDVKGIGEWTTHMFLIFCMGRLDVLAHGDLGIRNGIRNLYNLSAVPSPEDVDDLANKNNWHPYASVACWYVWQSLKNKPMV